MINLYYNTSGALLATIDEEQLDSLIDALEEEFLEDQDYAITPLTINYMQELGADEDLLGILRQALGEAEEITIRWARG